VVWSQVLAIRWFYEKVLEKMGGGMLNPAATSTLKRLMTALSYLMGRRRVHVPKALTLDVVEKVCRCVRASSADEMCAASMLVADFVWGARGINLYMTDWSDIVFQLEEAASQEAQRVIGLLWERLKIKNDRQGRKDGAKPLQCSSDCDGTLRVTEDGRLDGVPCPVHLLLASKELQAAEVEVPTELLVGPAWGAYALPENGVPDGTNVASVDVDAMEARVTPTVKVISKEEEAKGVRYDGSRKTATSAMLNLPKLAKARGTFYEVSELADGSKPDRTYIARSWADADGSTGKLRGLLKMEGRVAKKAGKAPAVKDVKSISSRSLRSGAASAMMDLPCELRMGILDHTDLHNSNGYVQREVSFKRGADEINVTDNTLRGKRPTDRQTQTALKEMAALSAQMNERLLRENEQLKMALNLQVRNECHRLLCIEVGAMLRDSMRLIWQGASAGTVEERVRNVLSARSASGSTSAMEQVLPVAVAPMGAATAGNPIVANVVAPSGAGLTHEPSMATVPAVSSVAGAPPATASTPLAAVHVPSVAVPTPKAAAQKAMEVASLAHKRTPAQQRAYEKQFEPCHPKRYKGKTRWRV
jgi:hypothetical protein